MHGQRQPFPFETELNCCEVTEVDNDNNDDDNNNFPLALRPNVDHGLLMLEVSRSHTTTHRSK